MSTIKRSWSQAGQDCFVHNLLVRGMGIQKGCFLDIGCSQPFIDNNTYHLEELGWRGLLVDIYDVAADPNHRIREVRSSPFLCADATKIDWEKTLPEYNIPTTIDYLSFDIDSGTIPGIKIFPWDKYKARVITIEHDLYQAGPEPKKLIEETLMANGYFLVCENVKHNDKTFEDWFVNPDLVPEKLWKSYICKDQEYSDIVPVWVHNPNGDAMNVFME